MLAQGTPSRYQWLLPSTVCIVGNRSVHDAGPLDVQRSGGSVKWESVSMILIPLKALIRSGFDSTMVTLRLRLSLDFLELLRAHFDVPRLSTTPLWLSGRPPPAQSLR